VASRVRKQISISLSEPRSAGYLPEEDQRQRFANYCERIKRPIIQKALGPGYEDLCLILVSSALPAEGKTFTASTLPLSMGRASTTSPSCSSMPTSPGVPQLHAGARR